MSSNKKSARGASTRQLRVGEELRHIVSSLLLRADLRDPDLVGVSVTVTEVTVSPDLKNATAYVTPLGGVNDDKVVAALNRSSAFLRGQLGRSVHLKFTPKLNFKIDDSFANATRIEDLIRKTRPQEGEETPAQVTPEQEA